MKILKAFAIVKKKNPTINLMDLYCAKDIAQVKIDKETEKVVPVVIQEA